MDKHELRKKIDELIYEVEESLTNEALNGECGRAYSLVRTKLQEAKMWTGKVLEHSGNPLPNEFRDYCKMRENKNG